MPRGIPNAPRPNGLGPSENTKRLLAAMADIEARLAAERNHDRCRGKLALFLERNPQITAEDLRAAAKMVGARKKGDAPVMSKQAHHGKPNLALMAPAKGKLGKAIRAARLKEGLTLDELGQRVGATASIVAGWERKGTPPKPAVHAALLDHLKLPKGLLPNGPVTP